MASNVLAFPSRPVKRLPSALNDNVPPEPPAPAAIAVPLRQRIERTIEVLIALLDDLDGDCDTELNGDERDSTDAEDEIGNAIRNYTMAPGCAFADGDGGEDHAEECLSYGVDQSLPINWQPIEWRRAA